jgi:leucyl-tRNA synthetase
MSVPASSGDDDLRIEALARRNVQAFTRGKEIRKVIVVPKKLVNVVCS